MTLQRSTLEFEAILVDNPSMRIQNAKIMLEEKDFPDVYGLFADVEAICYRQRFRIYYRLSREEYFPIYNLIGLKAALNVIYEPRIYVVVDESSFSSQISSNSLIDVLEKYNFVSILGRGEASSINALSDLDVLKCGLSENGETDDPTGRFDPLLSESPVRYTNHTKNLDRQLKLLMKGLPEKKSKPLTDHFPKLNLPPTVKGSKRKGN